VTAPLQPPTTPHLDHQGILRDRESFSTHSSTLLILPDPAYDARASATSTSGDALQKPVEKPLYTRLLGEEEDWRASGILHDFNNQLAIILSHCSIALTKLPNESKARTNLERAVRATKRAAELSNQLHIGRIAQSDGFTVVNWNELVHETVEAIEPHLAATATFDEHFAPDLPPITIIPSLMHRALLNILINAAEAIHKSHGVIRIVTDQVTVTDAPQQGHQQQLPPGAYLLIEVADNGDGMDQATLNQIFDPYFSTKAIGSGIGLTMSLSIIQLHQGIIQIRSKLGEGTTFRLLLAI